MRYMNRHWPRMLVTLVPVVFALMHALGTLPMGLMHRLDGIFYDARLRATQEQSHDDRIAIVDIDEKSLAEIGRWPWSRNKLATLTDVLFDQQKIAILGFDVVFAEPDDSSGAVHLTDLVQQRADLNAAMVTQLAEIRKELDYDAMFARTLQHRPVVLGYYFTSEATRRTSGVLPSPVIAQSSPVPAQATRAPWNGYGSNIPSLAQAAPLAGFFNSFTDPDGIVRSLPLIAFFDGKGYESLSLAIFRQLIKTPQVTGGFAPETPAGAVLQSVILHRGTQQFTIPVDDRAGLLVPYRGHGGVTGGSFTYVSASDVLSGRLPANSLKGKIVLVGSTAPGIVDLRATPMDAVYPGIEVHANVLSGLLDRRFLVKPDYAIGYEVVALLLAGVVLAAVLPALSALQACFMALLVGGGLIGLNLWLYLADGLVLPMASQVFVVAASFVLNMSYGYFIESRSKRELVQLFGTYVPPELVQEMMQDPGRYSMQARNEELTVMFCDMRGFTQLSEHMEPVALQQLLNRLFNELTTLIRASRGTVDKYMGDCVMAFWGAPVTTPNHASLAVGAALAMKQAIERINKEPGYSQMPAIGMGIGLSTGPMCVGDMGSEIRRSYTVIGNAVNVGSRLEGLSKIYGVPVVATETTRRQSPDFVWQELDRVRVKGVSQPITIFSPVALVCDVLPVQVNELDLWQDLLAHYRAQSWSQCDMLMPPLLETGQAKPLYALYAQRIAQMRRQPYDPDWDGVTNFETK